MGTGGFSWDEGAGAVVEGVGKNQTWFQFRQRSGKTHNPTRGFLFKASWSGFITCRTFILGSLLVFFFLSKLSFVFISFFLKLFDWTGPQLVLQGVTSWGSRETARVSFSFYTYSLPSPPTPLNLILSVEKPVSVRISKHTLHSGSWHV